MNTVCISTGQAVRAAVAERLAEVQMPSRHHMTAVSDSNSGQGRRDGRQAVGFV